MKFLKSNCRVMSLFIWGWKPPKKIFCWFYAKMAVEFANEFRTIYSESWKKNFIGEQNAFSKSCSKWSKLLFQIFVSWSISENRFSEYGQKHTFLSFSALIFQILAMRPKFGKVTWIIWTTFTTGILFSNDFFTFTMYSLKFNCKLDSHFCIE